jgi:hypothetical protein
VSEMGLDITAYEHVGEPLMKRGDMPDEKFYDCLDEGGLYVYNIDVFHGREAPLELEYVYHTSGKTLEDFMRFCNVVAPPVIERGLFT